MCMFMRNWIPAFSNNIMKMHYNLFEIIIHLIVFTKRISFESLLPTQPIAIFLAFRGEVTCFSMFLAIASLHLLLSNPRTG